MADTLNLDQRIRATFDFANNEFAGRSLAFIASIVADRVGVSYGRVFDALERTRPTQGEA